ncbi:twin-arginine translocase TatA/TatE family subunit [Georgenia sp. MJ206]|uniref:twin-arginine translocase TatA/TatE family subunit n=1 Tax=Georgenia wangjunii TaxID=3117730 RepID=UPI002F262103
MPISGSEAVVLLIIALIVVGPERLPVYAQQLARLARELKKMATGAQERVRTELGDEFADLDLAAFDPRQYDPRRIVREAFMEDDAGHTASSSRSAAGTLGRKPAGGTPGRTAAGAGAGAAGTAAGAGAPGAAWRGPGATRAAGGSAPVTGATGPAPTPFDDEAT